MWKLEPRQDLNTIVSPAPFAGSTRYKAKRKKLSTTKGEAKGRGHYVSYCPICLIPDMANPETAPHVTVQQHQRQASCRNGHRWRIC